MQFDFNFNELVEAAGYVGLFLIVFAESGLFFGFFLPGDSLLLAAGLVASRIDPATGRTLLDIRLLVPLLFVAAVLGDNVGYWFGAKAGPRIFNRENSLLFRRKNLLAAREFYDRHGGKTIVLARFLPFIRTFAPIVAGAVEMNYRRFIFFNVFGGALWAVGVTLAGYWLGHSLPADLIEHYFLLVIGLIIFISALPTTIHLWHQNRHEIAAMVKGLLAGRKKPREGQQSET